MGEFLSVIEWQDLSGQQLLHRFPEEGSANVQFGSQLVVEHTQTAIFFKDGKALDVFPPGRHTLSTKNIPLVTTALSLPFKFKSPFRVVVYFVNTKVFPDLKWGTRSPVLLKDSEFDLIRLRAHGKYAIRVRDCKLVLETLVGSMGLLDTSQICDYLASIIIEKLTQVLGKTLDSILGLPSIFSDLSAGVADLARPVFARYGLALQNAIIESISPPPAVAERIDDRSGMRALGDLDSYVKLSVADAIRNLPASDGGALPVSLGLGLAAGRILGSALDQGSQGPQGTQPQGIAEKLRELKLCLDNGLITTEQYEGKRQQLLDQL